MKASQTKTNYLGSDERIWKWESGKELNGSASLIKGNNPKLKSFRLPVLIKEEYKKIYKIFNPNQQIMSQ